MVTAKNCFFEPPVFYVNFIVLVLLLLRKPFMV